VIKKPLNQRGNPPQFTNQWTPEFEIQYLEGLLQGMQMLDAFAYARRMVISNTFTGGGWDDEE
jgi:hypothetical protein